MSGIEQKQCDLEKLYQEEMRMCLGGFALRNKTDGIGTASSESRGVQRVHRSDDGSLAVDEQAKCRRINPG